MVFDFIMMFLEGFLIVIVLYWGKYLVLFENRWEFVSICLYSQNIMLKVSQLYNTAEKMIKRCTLVYCHKRYIPNKYLTRVSYIQVRMYKKKCVVTLTHFSSQVDRPPTSAVVLQHIFNCMYFYILCKSLVMVHRIDL